MDKKIWRVREGENLLEFSYFSPDGENGYPGNVNFKVVYKLNNNELSVEYMGETDEDTIINLTNHSYFNLSGNPKEDCLNHTLYINSDKIAKLHKDGFVSGEFMDIENTAFDFRIPKEIGKDINNPHEQLILGGGYDHPYILNESMPQIKVCHKKSGRVLEIETDQKTVVLYTGNYLGKEGLLSSGANSIYRGAFCLETQNIPNHINIKGYENIVTKNRPYYAKTLYRFRIGGE